jgi:hypothetical protein
MDATWIKSDAAILTEEVLTEQLLVLEARMVCRSILSLSSANYHDMLEEVFVLVAGSGGCRTISPLGRIL